MRPFASVIGGEFAMYKIDIAEAEGQLSQLLSRVEKGEQVVILRDGRPVARLVACKRRPDILKGKIVVDDSFFDPLPEEELAAWEGR